MYKLTINFKTHQPNNFKKINNFLIFLEQKYPNKELNNTKNIILKKKVKNFTVLKSPHVHKKSREHFQYRLNKKLYYFKSKDLLPLLYINYLCSKQIQTDCITKSTITLS